MTALLLVERPLYRQGCDIAGSETALKEGQTGDGNALFSMRVATPTPQAFKWTCQRLSPCSIEVYVEQPPLELYMGVNGSCQNSVYTLDKAQC